MAARLTAERLGQRALDVNVLSERDLQTVWGELGSRSADFEQFKQVLLRRGLLTNYQLDRLVDGFRNGFFYGDYKVQYLVGAGTFARVYRATHRETNELFAVKVLRNRYSDKPKDYDLFRREGELGIQLKHPNIVAIHEVFSKAPSHFIVMDFVEGNNLRDFYKVRGRFAAPEATQISAGILAGLGYAFNKGITHRDLKMSNVIVSSDGEAKLVDFGLAGLGGDDGDDANPRTIDYAGLERATGVHRDDTRSDIFFVGCIFYQMLGGVPALAETRERSQRLSRGRYQDIRPLLDVCPGAPLPIARVVSKAIEFEPEKRYQTPMEMLTDLKLAMKRVENAKDAQVDAAVQTERLEGQRENGEAIKLMVLESDKKMQDRLRDLFKKYGYRVLLTSVPERLFERLNDDVKAFDVLLVSSGHLGKDAFETFIRLTQEQRTQSMPIVLLLGDNQASWQAKAPTNAYRRVISMPVKSRQLREAVARAVASK